MTNPFIAVLRGGYTGEKVISMQSARTMMEALDTGRYDAVYVTVDEGPWSCERADGTPLPFDQGTFTADRGQGPERFSAALIAIHGSPGEDGTLQGYLDVLRVPYQTGGVLCMALTMSKSFTTGLLGRMGFSVAPSLLLHRSDPDPAGRVLAAVGLPCFVKPDGSGSSLGISRVNEAAELPAALEKAFAEDEHVLCEALATGREVTCGVLPTEQGPMALPVCEIRTDRPFFDYEAKYHAASTQELVPAPLPDAATRLIQERSVAIYRALRCEGMVRVDHFWDESAPPGRDLVTIEVNTVPGFGPASILPKMLAAAQVPLAAAVNGMVERMLRG